MTDDQLFGEKDIEKENEVLRDENRRLRLRLRASEEEVMFVNAFLVEQGLAIKYIEWNKGEDV